MPISIAINPVNVYFGPENEFTDVLDFEELIGRRVTQSTQTHLKNFVAQYIHQLKARNIDTMKYKANGGIYTVSNPEYVDFVIEPGGNINVMVSEPAEVLGFERDFSEIKRNITMFMRGNLRQDNVQKSIASIVRNHSKEELKARETLRDQISEKEWRRYLVNGYVLIKGTRCFFEVDTESKKLLRGLQGPFVYQIFNDQRHIKVYAKGKLVKEICIHTSASECPPTDHILNMMMIIKHDEADLWDLGNIHEISKPAFRTERVLGNDKNLVEYYQSLKHPIEKVYVPTERFIDNVRIEYNIA